MVDMRVTCAPGVWRFSCSRLVLDHRCMCMCTGPGGSSAAALCCAVSSARARVLPHSSAFVLAVVLSACATGQHTCRLRSTDQGHARAKPLILHVADSSHAPTHMSYVHVCAQCMLPPFPASPTPYTYGSRHPCTNLQPSFSLATLHGPELGFRVCTHLTTAILCPGCMLNAGVYVGAASLGKHSWSWCFP